MDKIQDMTLLKAYYDKYHMDKLFSGKMLDYLELLQFNRLEYLSKEDEKMERLIFLVDGKAKVFKTMGNGKTLLVSFYTPFDVLGDLELIKEKKAACTVQAITPCYVLAIPMQTAREKLSKDYKFLSFACESLARKLDDMSSSSSVNLLYPLEKRLASYIHATAVSVCEADGSSYRLFNENLTYLAELLGTSYRHLLRTLNDLCLKEVVAKQKNGYQIINEKMLIKIGDLYQDF